MFVSLVLVSCAPLSTPPPPGGLPPAVSSDLNTAISNWNLVYGANVQAVGWSYRGRINSDSELDAVLSEILDPSRAWIPVVDVGDPLLANAELLSEFLPQISPEVLEGWEDTVKSLVRIGLHLVQIEWRKGNQSFTTTCVTDDSAIVYDNMLSNAALVESNYRRTCLDYVIRWLWGGERGRITIQLWAICRDGVVVNCNKDCSASMSLGSAKVNCSTRVSGNCCILDYSWAWGTPLIWITVEADQFTLKTSGIGSSGEGSGSCVDCCYEEVPFPD